MVDVSPTAGWARQAMVCLGPSVMGVHLGVLFVVSMFHKDMVTAAVPTYTVVELLENE